MGKPMGWGGRRWSKKPGPAPAADPTQQISARVPGWVIRWLRQGAGAAGLTLSSYTARRLEEIARIDGAGPEAQPTE